MTKAGSKVLQKVYYAKTVASGKAVADFTNLIGLLLFEGEAFFQKLNQT